MELDVEDIYSVESVGNIEYDEASVASEGSMHHNIKEEPTDDQPEETDAASIQRFGLQYMGQFEDPVESSNNRTKNEDGSFVDEDMDESNDRNASELNETGDFEENSSNSCDARFENRGCQLSNFVKISKAMEAADYETLQMVYELIYQRSGWDTKDNLVQSILQFSGFTFGPESDNYCDRKLVLKSLSVEDLVKIGAVLNLDEVAAALVEPEKGRLKLIESIMQFLSKPQKKPRRKGVEIRENSANAVTCGCRANCLSRFKENHRKTLLEYVQMLEKKKWLNDYFFSLISMVKVAKTGPGSDHKQRNRDILYHYKAKYGDATFTVCKNAFCLLHGVTVGKICGIQTKMKAGKRAKKKVYLPFPDSEPLLDDRIAPSLNFGAPATPTPDNPIIKLASPSEAIAISSSVPPDTSSSAELKPPHAEAGPASAGILGPTDGNGIKDVKIGVDWSKEWTMQDLNLAIEGVHAGMSMRAAARKYNVPYSTVQQKMFHQESNGRRFGRKTVFNRQQELDIYNHLLTLQDLYHGITIQQMRKFVYEYAERKGIDNRFNRDLRLAGRDWVMGFLKRHPIMNIKKER